MEQKPIECHGYQELEVQGTVLGEEASDSKAVREALGGEKFNIDLE